MTNAGRRSQWRPKAPTGDPMTILRHDETDRFRVRDDDGNEYEIVEHTAIMDANTFDDPDATMLGTRSLRTTDSRHVNVQGDKYEILTDGEPTVMATRID